jgi:hypothetical protein
MERYAQIKDGIVQLVIESEVDPDGTNGEWVACGDAGPGWLYDGSMFTAPPDPAPTPVRTLTKLQYMNRFTDGELASIYTAAKSNVAVEIWLEKFKLASEVNLDDASTVAGLQAMEAVGLLASGRAAEILGTSEDCLAGIARRARCRRQGPGPRAGAAR